MSTSRIRALRPAASSRLYGGQSDAAATRRPRTRAGGRLEALTRLAFETNAACRGTRGLSFRRNAAAYRVDEERHGSSSFGDLRHLRNDIVDNPGLDSRDHDTRCADGSSARSSTAIRAIFRYDELQWMQPSVPWATPPRGSAPDPAQYSRFFRRGGRIVAGFRVLVVHSPIAHRVSGFM